MKIFKFLLLLIFISIAIRVSAQQITSGIVTYKIDTEATFKRLDSLLKEKPQQAALFHSMYDPLKMVAEDALLELKFKGNESQFAMKAYLATKEEERGAKKFKSIYEAGGFYTDISKNVRVQKLTGFDKNLKIESIPWELTNETKKIGKYTTYKGIYHKLFDDGKKRQIIAWYTPEINAPFGPKEYSGLPGLVLEVDDITGTYMVNEIILNPTEEIQITKPDESIMITREEYNKLGREFMAKIRMRSANKN
ncbi:GLPGLI family protein [Zhouia sp. PK063]|uniref:GLPGLI family protein n=1 Tax=Zhouia sp. PK063 TaxID=3373602 RepID=UPI0037952CDB